MPTADPAAVMECTACGSPDAMERTDDLITDLEQKCGEIWTCGACGAEYIDEW
ncbi:hypothetical protein [Nocardia acidivorans]|uniref:hypothetical protein n=1 Tax=Nocardia acidivorans TaxID=404580 RepID=UPI001C3F8332|nr:hypothetical protein [Nocardia acidivorans]